jgi:alpha/beta superfamily hydrolase
MRIPFQIGQKGKTILGILNVANCQRDVPVVVVMCYGLNGNRVEQHRMSVKMAKIACTNDINFVQADYRGCGVSDGDFFENTISERVEDTLKICEFLRGCFSEIEIKIILIGFSDGFKVAVQAAHDVSGKMGGLIFWNPIFKVPISDAIQNKQNNSKAVSKADRLVLHPKFNKLSKPLYGLYMNLSLIKEIEKDSTIEILDKMNIQMLFVFGENDRFTTSIRTYVEKTFAKPNTVSIGIVSDAGHVFSHSKYEEQVFDYTMKWINQITRKR